MASGSEISRTKMVIPHLSTEEVVVSPALGSKVFRSPRQSRVIANFESIVTRDACVQYITKKMSSVKIQRMKDLDLVSHFAFAAVSNKRITIWIAGQKNSKQALSKAGFEWLRKNLTNEIANAIALGLTRRDEFSYRFINAETIEGKPIFTLAEENYPLRWSDIRPGEESPQLNLKSRIVERFGDHIEVHHVYTGFCGTDTHIFSIRLNSISSSILKTINLHKTFPNIVQHGHKVMHGNSTAFTRSLEERDVNSAKRALEHSGNVVKNGCRFCNSQFAGLKNETVCAECDIKIDKNSARN